MLGFKYINDSEMGPIRILINKTESSAVSTLYMDMQSLQGIFVDKRVKYLINGL